MPADAERRLNSQIAAHLSWANTENRTSRTAPARAALEARFLADAGGDPVRAANLRTAYYKRLALKSAQARRRAAAGKAGRADLIAVKAELSAQLAEIDAELGAAGGDAA